MSNELKDLANIQSGTRKSYLGMDPEGAGPAWGRTMNPDKKKLVIMRAFSLDIGLRSLERTLINSAGVAFGSLVLVMAHVE